MRQASGVSSPAGARPEATMTSASAPASSSVRGTKGRGRAPAARREATGSGRCDGRPG